MDNFINKNILSTWLIWHFIETPKFLLKVWENYFLFALNYFSLPVLLKSLFAPWHRYRWNYPRGFELGEFFSTLISNTFSRFIGAIIRIILSIIGLVFQLLVVIVGLFIIIFWITMPLIIIAGFLFVFLY